MDLTETADIVTSSADYAARFHGPSGQWMLKVQEEYIMSLLNGVHDCSILEPGGGHAQITPVLLAGGARVTVVGSSEACAERLEPFRGNPQLRFQTGNLIELNFADREFDSVVSVRFISHCSRWKEFISEICRVSRHSVIIDYPPRRSFNFFFGALFSLKKRFEGNTRHFAVFSDREIYKEFSNHGFVPERRSPQFFFPMVVHRLLKCPVFSKLIEKAAAIFGLRALFGSPVLVKMVRGQD